jgi:ABC-2 type transport system permease protein
MKGLISVLYREYRFRITNITFLFWDIFVPITYLLIFGYGFQRSIGSSFHTAGYGADYASFFLAGVLSMTCFSIAMNTSWRYFTERENGIFYEVLTYPVSRQQLVVGKILFNVFLSLAGAVLAILSGEFFMNVEIQRSTLLWTMLAIGFGTAGWFFFFAILALRLRRIDSFNTVTSICYILLMFASSLFYPLENLPSWFRICARLNPVTWQTDVLRFTTLGVGDLSVVLMEGAAFVVFTTITFFAAVKALNHAGE